MLSIDINMYVSIDFNMYVDQHKKSRILQKMTSKMSNEQL